jgi:hypothetical protein
MEHKHTLGPWHINGSEIEALVIPEESDTYFGPVCVVDSGWTDETNKANAKLIAAAPDLLKALTYILSNLDGMGIKVANRDLAEEAIKKATE